MIERYISVMNWCNMHEAYRIRKVLLYVMHWNPYACMCIYVFMYVYVCVCSIQQVYIHGYHFKAGASYARLRIAIAKI